MSSLSRLTAATAGVVLAGIALSSGCSSSASQSPNGIDGTGANGSGANGSGNSGTVDGQAINLKDAPSADGITNFDAGPDGGCGTSQITAHLTPVNLIFIVDKSGSMGADPPQSRGAQDKAIKWDPMVAAFTQFFNSVTSPAMYASFMFFPVPCSLDLTPGAGGGCVCSADEYNPATTSQAVVPLTKILGHANTFTALLNQTLPDGGTPTIAALQGSYNYASTIQAKAEPGELTSVILITDGAPGFGGCPLADGGTGGCEGCTGNNVNTIKTLVQQYHDQGIDTRVFGVGSLPALDAFATAGGWPKVTINVGDAQATTQQFVEELGKIPVPVFACSAPVPAKAPDGTPVDRSKVNVVYTNASQTTPALLYSNPGCAGTSSGAIGWQYVGDTIQLCADTCNQLKVDATTALTMQFGCVTIQVPT
jgi:hypothetical protein